MNTIARILAGLYCFCVTVSCASGLEMKIPTRKIIVYPHFAPKERAEIIRGNYKQVTSNMSSASVVMILGDPDEIQLLYEPMVKQGQPKGYTYWYVIRRLAENGSVNEKSESLVRISFSLNNIVSRVDAWGLE